MPSLKRNFRVLGELEIWANDTDSAAAIKFGDGRINLNAVTVNSANAGSSDFGVIGIGTSSSRVSVTGANMRFININVENAATSGDNRAMYLRQFLTGAGSGGEALRAFQTVEDVRAGTVHGAHISLNWGDTGSASGFAAAVRATLHLANQAYTSLPGTFAAIQAQIWSDGATTDPVGLTELAFLSFSNGGNASGIADVDDDVFLFSIGGGGIGAGNLVQADTDEIDYSHKIRIKVHGSEMFLMVADS